MIATKPHIPPTTETQLLRCLDDMLGWAETFLDNLGTYAKDCPMTEEDAARYQYEMERAKRLRNLLIHQKAAA